VSGLILRPARRGDCVDIARLFLASSDGLAEYIWGPHVGGRGSFITVGTARYAREGVAFSFRNCIIAEYDGRVAGMMHSFPMDEPAEGAAPETDPVLRPYAELEDYGSLYVSGVAVYPDFRSLGIGTRLLEAADGRAQSLARPRVSLICFDENRAALGLYRRFGYREIDRRPIHPHPTLHFEKGDALLLVRDVDVQSALRQSTGAVATAGNWHAGFH